MCDNIYIYIYIYIISKFIKLIKFTARVVKQSLKKFYSIPSSNTCLAGLNLEALPFA